MKRRSKNKILSVLLILAMIAALLPVFPIAAADDPPFTTTPMISAGRSHTLALDKDGNVWAWGYNYYGQLGDGTTTQRTTPVQVYGLTDVIAIS
ncbi:MAG: RCC1 domain-containing protein, partial [Oscillospiraceae bacterium]|nr:RCC1 domain-containing protein [Oscillospiraceae bacterium]